jgi:RHO1 GDP-GTP exchange protein 1/2
MKPLQTANPRIIPLEYFDEFMEDVFGNILELRECNRRLVEIMHVRLREEGPIVKRIGDVFLNFAAEFRVVYPTYVGRQSMAEKRLKEEIESNAEFRLFLEV